MAKFFFLDLGSYRNNISPVIKREKMDWKLKDKIYNTGVTNEYKVFIQNNKYYKKVLMKVIVLETLETDTQNLCLKNHLISVLEGSFLHMRH